MSTTGGTIFQTRGRSNSKLTVVYDSEGREVEAESREDEEQNVKLTETIDLLLAAGYFRARIKGLSPFDKVVGGMTWCITTCNFDIDIDLLFQENSTIGQKIALTEKIVAMLPLMKCPFRIEPHQIQGMDFIHIYPVVQWLVKRAIETREEMGDMNRKFSVSQFNKYNQLPEDMAISAIKTGTMKVLSAVKTAYGPRRKFRRLGPLKQTDEETRVQSTLLEYGRRHGITRSAPNEPDPKAKGKDHIAVTDKQLELEEKRIEALMGSMTLMEGQKSRLTASVVGSMVGMQSEEIKKASEVYAQMQVELEQQADRPGTQQHHKKMVAALQKQVSEKREQQQKLEQAYEQKKTEYLQLKDRLEQINLTSIQLQEEVSKLEEKETGENQIILEKLTSLVTIHDKIKKQEQDYKLQCKEELAKLQKTLEDLKSATTVDADDEERFKAIEKQHDTEKSKLHKMRLTVAKRNREIASLQRKIDEAPSRAELSQYQRRFVELYNQIAATHKETKQFYTLYNTMENSKGYLEKEVNLLNSIYDNYQAAMSSQATKDQFLKQLEQIVEGVKGNRAKVEKQKQQEKMKRDRLNDLYLELLEKQRMYFKTVKEFKEECRKNEILLEKFSTV